MNPLMKFLDAMLAPEAVEATLQTGAVVAGVVAAAVLVAEAVDLMKKLGRASASILRATADHVSAQAEVARANAARIRPPVAPLLRDEPLAVTPAN